MSQRSQRSQAAALVVCVVLLAACAGLLAGFFLGREHAWSYLDAATIERRLREVFCEQALRNGVLRTCDATFSRYSEK